MGKFRLHVADLEHQCRPGALSDPFKCSQHLLHFLPLLLSHLGRAFRCLRCRCRYMRVKLSQVLDIDVLGRLASSPESEARVTSK